MQLSDTLLVLTVLHAYKNGNKKCVQKRVQMRQSEIQRVHVYANVCRYVSVCVCVLPLQVRVDGRKYTEKK